MWRIPVSLIAGGTDVIVTITEDTLIGNLYTFLNSPSGPQVVQVTVDGADVGDVQITADWAGGSTFEIICINGGRLLGLGGDGGDGGDDFGATGSVGSVGGDGGHALTSDGFTVNLDIDDGFLFSGGGAGGGGSWSSTNNSPGGGGGGGQGFAATIGGAAGSPTGTPIANPGQDGGQTGAGNGGAGGDVGNNDGGGAGTWGYGGALGGHVTSSRAGSGGRAGAAYTGSGTLVHSGAKNESQLVSEGRILGDLGFYIDLPNNIVNFALAAPSKTGGWLFVNDTAGTLRKINSVSGNFDYTDWWAVGTVTTADFEVRDVVGTRVGTWTNDPTGAEGDWRALSTAALQWDLVAVINTVSQAFEIRRTSDTGGIVASGYLSVELADFS